MPFDAIKFLDDYRIRHAPLNREGWVNIRCPMCGDHGDHLGINISGNCNCWKCGPHKLDTIVTALLLIPSRLAWRIVRQYKTKDDTYIPPVLSVSNKDLRWPMGMGPMSERHRRYLAGRGFDPGLLELVWGLKGTDRMDPDYRWRIVAPVIQNGRPVSYQARDITGSHPLRYRACDPENELVPIKQTIYGIDLAAPKGKCVVVEGITGAWRLGPGAVATFGTGWTPQQLHLLGCTFSRVFVFFDPKAKMSDEILIEIQGKWERPFGRSIIKEEAAEFAAERLAKSLRPMGVSAETIWTDDATDPGELSDGDAAALMKELGLR